MEHLPQVASPPTPPPQSSLFILFVQAFLFAILWNPLPQAQALEMGQVFENTSQWVPPVPRADPADVLQPFVAPEMPWSAAHRGIDIQATTDEVIAPADGEVVFVGQVVDRPVLTLRHGNGLLSSFEPIESELKVGSTISQGDLVGTISTDTAHCETRCMHWGVRVPDGWHIGSTVRDLYIDPGFLLGWTEPSVLWPVYSDPKY